MRRFTATAAAYIAVLALAAIVVSLTQGAPPSSLPPAVVDEPDIELVSALEPFDDCDGLLSYFRTEALERVGPWGLDGGMHIVADALESAVDAPASGEARAAAGGGGTSEFSATNVQEAGVDEPDIVKTDGRRVVVLAGDRLHVLTGAGGELQRRGSVRVGGAGELLLDGDRVLVLGHGGGVHGPIPPPGPAASRAISPSPISSATRIALVDITDPDAPREAASLSVDGSYVSARAHDGTARVVLRSHPVALPFVTPEGGGLRAEREATRRNREVVRESTIDQWLPYAIVERAGGDGAEQPLLDCSEVHRPDDFAGFGTVSVLSIGLGDTLRPDASAAVVGDAQTVYASDDNLFVATNEWVEQTMEWRPEATSTAIHQFDISDAAGARYVASGSVAGRLLNQWALSEHDGHLRVATTRQRGDGRDSDSAVTVLRADGRRLRRVGHVDGLGRTEQIYAVRYAGPVAYVVTFRQVDPLYTLDLSNPSRPRVRGELKITGYSSYLHPVGEGRVLGIGQAATARGRVLGTQVSLFDVTDLAAPQRIDQLRMGAGDSAAEHDHRAFLHWPKTGTVVVPLQTWSPRPFSGAAVLKVDDRSVRQIGRISHPADGQEAPGHEAPIHRSLVVGDQLLTVSQAGVLASDLTTLQRRGWIELR